MDNQYPPKIPFMVPSLWVVSIMIFLYIIISLMVGFDPQHWNGLLQSLFVLGELACAIFFIVCKIELDADYIKRYLKK